VQTDFDRLPHNKRAIGADDAFSGQFQENWLAELAGVILHSSRAFTGTRVMAAGASESCEAYGRRCRVGGVSGCFRSRATAAHPDDRRDTGLDEKRQCHLKLTESTSRELRE
jgi:hypothetical protein